MVQGELVVTELPSNAPSLRCLRYPPHSTPHASKVFGIESRRARWSIVVPEPWTIGSNFSRKPLRRLRQDWLVFQLFLPALYSTSLQIQLLTHCEDLQHRILRTKNGNVEFKQHKIFVLSNYFELGKFVSLSYSRKHQSSDINFHFNNPLQSWQKMTIIFP